MYGILTTTIIHIHVSTFYLYASKKGCSAVCKRPGCLKEFTPGYWRGGEKGSPLAAISQDTAVVGYGVDQSPWRLSGAQLSARQQDDVTGGDQFGLVNELW